MVDAGSARPADLYIYTSSLVRETHLFKRPFRAVTKSKSSRITYGITYMASLLFSYGDCCSKDSRDGHSAQHCAAIGFCDCVLSIYFVAVCVIRVRTLSHLQPEA